MIVEGEEATEPYQNLNATLVTLKRGSNISITLAEPDGEGFYQRSLIQDGGGKYTYIVAAIELFGDDFGMHFLSRDGEAMKEELKAGAIQLTTGEYNNEKHYIVAYESASAPSNPASPTCPPGNTTPLLCPGRWTRASPTAPAPLRSAPMTPVPVGKSSPSCTGLWADYKQSQLVHGE